MLLHENATVRHRQIDGNQFTLLLSNPAQGRQYIHNLDGLLLCTNLPGANLNSRAKRDWPQRGKVQDVLCKSSILTICQHILWRDMRVKRLFHVYESTGQTLHHRSSIFLANDL